MAMIHAVIAGLSAGVALEFALPAMVRRCPWTWLSVAAGAAAVLLCPLHAVRPWLGTAGAVAGLLAGASALAVRVSELRSGQLGSLEFSLRGVAPYTLLISLGVYSLL
ncbi:MAG: hypothetical protein ABGY09_00515 [Euryarchaeota archaeon]